MAGRLVDDVRRGRVLDVLDLPHVRRDDQHAVRLELHERRGRDEAVDRRRAPADPAEDRVHLLDARDPLEADTGSRKPVQVRLVRVLAVEVDAPAA